MKVLTTQVLSQHGLSFRDISALLNEGKLVRIKRGFYIRTDDDTVSDINILTTLFPDAIVYRESALALYSYIDRTPPSWHLAVDAASSRNRFSITYPRVSPHFLSSYKLPLGKTTITVDGTLATVYDRERTICDILLHRNKIEAEMVTQAIRSYIDDPMRDIAQLINYAPQLRVERKVREVFGPWI